MLFNKSILNGKSPQMNLNTDWATKEPIISQFTIEGLFGYKSITLDFSEAIKIVTAENGTGKTTLLNALYWSLTGQLFRLQTIHFDQIHIQFQSGEKIDLVKKDISSIYQSDKESSQGTRIRRWGLTEAELSLLMETYIAFGDGEIFTSCEPYIKLYQESPWDYDEIRDRVHSLAEQYIDKESFIGIRKQIDNALRETEILYLPTYRRIEASLGTEKIKKAEGSRDRLIYFGLSDVEETLNEITAGIKTSALAAYTKINATILDNLVATGESNSSAPQAIDSIDTEAMKMVLARIGKNDTDPTVRKIDALIQNGQINDAKYYHLQYFLSELTNSSKLQAAQEDNINKFISVVNGYWNITSAEKEFIYDKYKVEVFVLNRLSESRIPLQVLSSGEKQIVSIFSRLYFSKAKSYFVIIDEPELSLSIDWQRLFLPNVVASPKCNALLAITHSPFIFENDLDKFASSLKIDRWPS